MKVNIVKNGNVVKKYDVWSEEEKRAAGEEERVNFSAELLKEIRDNKSKVDIRDVMELLQLGADPNYKLLAHTDEDLIKKQIDAYDYDELQYVSKMKMIKWSTLALAISIQAERPDVIEALFKYGADANLDFSDIDMAQSSPTAFFFSATRRSKDLNIHERILDMFVKNGADVSVTDNNGNNAIHICAKLGNLSIIPKLIELGIDPFQKNKDGQIPYDVLTEKNINALTGLSHNRNEDNPEMQEIENLLRPEVKEEPRKRFFGKK